MADWQEDVAEFLEVQFSVTVCVVPAEEQEDVVVSEVMEADLPQGEKHVLYGHISCSLNIEDLEGVKKIEVRLEGTFDLRALEFSLEEDVVFEDPRELLLLNSVEGAKACSTVVGGWVNTARIFRW